MEPASASAIGRPQWSSGRDTPTRIREEESHRSASELRSGARSRGRSDRGSRTRGSIAAPVDASIRGASLTRTAEGHAIASSPDANGADAPASTAQMLIAIIPMEPRGFMTTTLRFQHDAPPYRYRYSIHGRNCIVPAARPARRLARPVSTATLATRVRAARRQGNPIDTDPLPAIDLGFLAMCGILDANYERWVSARGAWPRLVIAPLPIFVRFGHRLNHSQTFTS